MNPAEMRQRLRNYARSQPADKWFKIVNAATGPAQVAIFGDIGFFGTTASEFCDQLSAINGPIDLYINSGGGEIFDGLTIYNALLRRDVSVYIDGVAASAASFIAQAAAPGKLGMAKSSTMMIHNGQAFAAGDAADLRKMADILDAETRNIAEIYADRSGRPVQQFLDMMGSETWLKANAAVDAGLADFVYDPRTGPSNVTHVRPKNANSGWVRRDGKWVFDPDGDGDDDGSPSGDTDHDYWAADGTQLKAVPPDPDGRQGCPMPGNDSRVTLYNAKYHQEDRDRMAKSGEAMADGSYPVADEEDLHNAIHAVGRGGADHDAIRAHIVKRAHALGHAEAIPDNWNSDGSLKTSASDSADLGAIGALLANALKG